MDLRVIIVLITLLLNEQVLAYSNLEGKRVPCQLEGEPMFVNHIDPFNCYSCICKNGFVECKSDYYCPPTDGCHMLVEKTKNGCCQQCKGCIYNGVHYLSHTEWTDPENPCKVLRCEAGIVTESDLQCYTPCANPLPPEPGKCCPTCPECKINGQIATDDRDVISDDPCVKCRCSRGRMICSKKACPVLQCVQPNQKHLPGECCPVCVGTRSLLAAAKTCTIQSKLCREGERFNIDRCTSCICQNETTICQRAACPILDCAPDLQKFVPGSNSCCKQCAVPEEIRAQCSYGGKYYEDGQSWKLDACGSCKCYKGRPSCAMTRCNVTVPCPSGTQLVKIPGECCEKCVEADGVCMVFGDPHYKTFDGKVYSFQGIGKYQLVTDCKNQSFSIRIANVFSNKSKSSTTVKRVAIRYGDIRLNLQQKGRVKFDGKRIKFPFKKENKIRIEKRTDNNIEIIFQNGMKVLWTGQTFLEVSVPVAFKNKLCGLCGNFNSNAQDELTTKRGRILKDHDIYEFTNSWCVGSKTMCLRANRPQIGHAKNNPHCPTNRSEKNRCKFLSNSELFGDCDSKLNYNKYYKTCKYDMCNCPNNKCYCDSLMAYARECERLQVKLPNWKKLSFCDTAEEHNKRPKTSKPPLHFTKDQLLAIAKQRKFNRTRIPKFPLLIH